MSTAALRESPVMMQTLRRVGGVMRVPIRIDAMAQEVIDIIEAEYGYQFGAVLMVHPTTRSLLPIAVSDQGRGRAWREADRRWVAEQGLRIGDGVTGWSARTGQTARIGDVSHDRRYVGLRNRIRSELCVPLLVGSRVVGVFNTETPRRDAYGPDDAAVVGVCAAMLALANQVAQTWPARVAIPIAAEGRHRACNDIAALPGLIELSADDGPDALAGRIRVLAWMHTRFDDSWSPLGFGQLARGVVSGLAGRHLRTRGGATPIGPRQAPALALLLYELAARGTISPVIMSWSVDDHGDTGRRLTVHWWDYGASPGPENRFLDGLLGFDLLGRIEWRFGGVGAHRVTVDLDPTD